MFVGLPIGELLLFALGPIVSIALWYLIPLSNKSDLIRNRWISYIPVIVAIVLFVVLQPQGWMLIFPVLGL